MCSGSRGFWSLDLAVSPATLIPRPDSETLVEAALAAFRDRGAALRVLDLGTGTGALLLAVLAEFPAAFGVGVDVVPAAAALARENAQRCGLGARAAFCVGDWGAALAGAFDLVLCNPPYIETAALAGLMPEVARFEPISALDGGADGLAAYRAVMAGLPGLLAPGGWELLSWEQGRGLPFRALAQGVGLDAAPPRPDLGGIPRALVVKKAFGVASGGA